MLSGAGGGAKYGVSGTTPVLSGKSYSIVGAGGKLPVNIFGGNYCNGGDQTMMVNQGHFAYHGMQQIMH